MNIAQVVERPFGINVFGSAIIRVDPDVAMIKFAVSRLQDKPQDAFREAHEGVQNLRNFLSQAKLEDVGSSRITLNKMTKYSGYEEHFLGYLARVSFQLLLRDLDRMEDILTGIIGAGVNEIQAVDFQTSRLKQLRAEARRRAVEAAREKAENYCKAANVSLGMVIHIEDVNPDKLQGREGHSMREMAADDEGAPGSFNPGSIVVGGAVVIAYEIAHP